VWAADGIDGSEENTRTDLAGGRGPGFDEARLLVSRFMLSNYAVEGKDFIMDYGIYNVGDRAALGVTLDETAFHTDHFEVVRGLLNVKWERIGPGANVSHSVVLRPKTPGTYNFTWAEVSYRPNEEAVGPDQRRRVFSTALTEASIYRLKDFERRFSPRLLDWALFALMTVPSLAMPALLWYRTQAKYEAIAAGSKKQS
jgi:translocon-associated protein subunit beta